MSKSAGKKSNRSLSGSTLFFILIVIVVICFIASFFFNTYKNGQVQNSLERFYSAPAQDSNNKPGRLIRYEKINVVVPGGGSAYRILYVSELSDGTPTVSSGMIIIPNGEAPPGGRTVIAWAHGTIGMGEECAPSRSKNPFVMLGGLSEMMQRGWIVAATDYYGLGTLGTERYLIGEDEARDVINSVRAAQNLKEAKAGSNFLLWGHSQGGHAVLFAANLAGSYAPELNLKAVAAAAPAAELESLISQQYKTAVSWVIGPEINIAWPYQYPQLLPEKILSKAALKNYKRIADECITEAGIEGIVRNKLKESYFVSNPATIDVWKKALQEQTPKPVLGIPVFIAQGLADNVVLPNTTALFIKNSCNAGSNVTVAWMGQVGHIPAAIISGPFVVSWLEERLEGLSPQDTCAQPLPVEPAEI